MSTPLDRFNQNYHDPHEFDINALGLLENKYRPMLFEVRQKIVQDHGLEIGIDEFSVTSKISWELLSRHLLLAFAVGEALQVKPTETVQFCALYSRFRLIPIQLFNHAIDEIVYEEDNLDARTQIAEIGLINLFAQLEGYSYVPINPNWANFWSVHSELTGRVVRLAYNEFVRRFDKTYIHNPDILLDLYGSEHSPLLRSSTLETFMKGLARIKNIKLQNEHWLTSYEQARQMLDDLGDLWQDLLVGRINYPILLALKDNKTKENLKPILVDLWNDLKIGKTSGEVWAYSESVYRLLLDADAFNQTCKLVSLWLDQVDKEVTEENFPGNIDSLYIIIDLKRAYLNRLVKLDFKNIKPQYRFSDQAD